MKLSANKSLMLVVIVAIALIASTSLNGCEKCELFVPEYTHLNPPPEEVTIEQIYNDYYTSEVEADSKYRGQRIMFSNITVDEVFGRYYAQHHGGIVYVKEYFITQSVKFELEDFNLMQNVEKGYVINIIGECQGLSHDLLIIDNCWIEGVNCDLGIGSVVSFY